MSEQWETPAASDEEDEEESYDYVPKEKEGKEKDKVEVDENEMEPSVLEDKLEEALEALTEKRTSTREEALKSLKKLLHSNTVTLLLENKFVFFLLPFPLFF